jgi:hypothetical protein
MARAITWAIRITLADGRDVFARGGGLGSGPITTYYTKAAADVAAEQLRRSLNHVRAVTVIERSHGKHWAERATK